MWNPLLGPQGWEFNPTNTKGRKDLTCQQLITSTHDFYAQKCIHAIMVKKTKKDGELSVNWKKLIKKKIGRN